MCYEYYYKNYFMIKKVSFAALLIAVFAQVGQGQGLYSRQTLEKASVEDLSLSLTKAHNLKKTGIVISILGSSAVIAGIVLMSAGESTAYFGFGVFFGGLGCSAIGIPILLTGSSRVKRISKVWNDKYNAVWMELVPSGLYNYQTRNIQPGISLRIRF
jgi:hypothetical protein